MSIVTWKDGFRELTVDGWTESPPAADGSVTYEAVGGPKDAEVVWSSTDRQPHGAMPAGSKITYWPGKKLAKIVKA